MIDLITFRNQIIRGLYSYLNRPVILLEQAEQKPEYPFIAYIITTPYNPQPGQDTIVIKNKNDDLELIRKEQPTVTFSFTAYSKSEIDSQNLALQARQWFEFYGYDYIRELAAVVVECTSAQHRNSLIIDDYERRIGFDVIFRVSSEVSKDVVRIETVDIEKE